MKRLLFILMLTISCSVNAEWVEISSDRISDKNYIHKNSGRLVDLPVAVMIKTKFKDFYAVYTISIDCKNYKYRFLTQVDYSYEDKVLKIDSKNTYWGPIQSYGVGRLAYDNVCKNT